MNKTIPAKIPPLKLHFCFDESKNITGKREMQPIKHLKVLKVNGSTYNIPSFCATNDNPEIKAAIIKAILQYMYNLLNACLFISPLILI